MKICLVSQEYPPETARGGIGSQNWNKAHRLAELGHTVHVLSSSSSSGPELRTERDGAITVHRMQPPGSEFPVFEEHTFWIGYSWSVLRHLTCLMQSEKFDLVDFAEYGGEGFAYQLDRGPWNWVPVVVQLHGPLTMFAERIGWPERDSDLYRIGTFMEDISIRRADALMACSANIADFTAAFHEVERDSIDVVHCGVDASNFAPELDRMSRGSAPPIVLFVGNLAANKGLNTVLDAVLRLRARYPAITLQVVGKGDDDIIRELEGRAEAAGARENLDIVGFVQDRSALPRFYRRANVFCSPAHHEVGVANVYLEAMASGCPVVAGETGGAPEAIVDGETGLLVPVADVDATAAALDRILGDEDLQHTMGRSGRARVEEYFAMDRYIERVLGTYETAIARSRRRLAQRAAAPA
jgi:glycosyltransferase involved in cell wall biosynthesis